MDNHFRHDSFWVENDRTHHLFDHGIASSDVVDFLGKAVTLPGAREGAAA